MKKKLLLFLLLVLNLCYAQTPVALTPVLAVDVKGKKDPSEDTKPFSPFTNLIVTENQVSGNADPKSTVKITYKYPAKDDKGTDIEIPVEFIAFVNYKGYFEQKLNPPLPKDVYATLYCIDENGKESSPEIPPKRTADEVLSLLRKGEITLPTKSFNPEIYDAQPASTTYSYDVKMVNTNFTIPIVRFNIANSKSPKEGDVLLFNSIGAGVGLSWGELSKTTDATGETINTDYTNWFGLHFGVLFSAGSNGSENKNIFAPTFSISTLDFQVGAGYEMGTVAASQTKFFITIAYAIPLSKLIKGKYYILKSSKGYNSKNPLKEEKENKKKVGRFI